jgi:glucokinase
VKVLCGDVGGTKCLLGVSGGEGRVLEASHYASRDFPDFAGVVRAFLASAQAAPQTACFAVAGPVEQDLCRATNLPWLIDARVLEAELGLAHVRLCNDFYAQALAVLALPPSDLIEIHPGRKIPDGPIAVLGAGTGLGEAFLVSANGRYEVVPSEGGHVDFAPTNDRQIDLLRYLQEKLGGRVSYERLLSGAGLVQIYAFLRGPGQEPLAIREAMQREDPAAVVSRLGLTHEDPVCDAALDLFCEIYGQEAGNLALKVLATGGVYLCGGIAPRILPRLQAGPFQRAFSDKGRMSPLVDAIPVRVVVHPHSGLVGAAALATRLRGPS